ncbi:MAG: hypothetical protein OEZ59_11985 [Deltaproteobacteria bacterium]|nr:hypothetical protein [Deltaproteobacteria bacterium]
MSIQDDPFALFCIYYLGLTPEGEVRFFNANQVAQRYRWSVEGLMGALARHGLHPDKVINTDFPLSRHQIDFQMAAEEGLSAEVLHNRARMVYEKFRAATGKRDWLKEIDQEKAASGGQAGD